MTRQSPGTEKASETKPGGKKPSDQPPGEEDFGGGDFCSPEQQPSTDDDKPLD